MCVGGGGGGGGGRRRRGYLDIDLPIQFPFCVVRIDTTEIINFQHDSNGKSII